MYHVLLIALKDIKNESKNLKRIILVAIVSLIIIAFISNGLQFLFKEGIFVKRVDIIIVNQDTHPLSNLLIHQVSEDANIKSIMNIHRYDDVKEAEDKIRQNNAVGAIIIPRGFVNSLEVGRNYPVRLITNSANPVLSDMIESLLDSYMRSVSAGQSAVNAVWDYYGYTDMTHAEKSQKINSVINDITLRAYLARNNVMQKEVILSMDSISSLQFYLFSILVLLTMFIGISGARDIVFERNSLILRRLQLGGVSKVKYLLGKYIYIIIKILIQSSIIICISTFFLVRGEGIETVSLILMLLMLVVLSIVSVGLLGSVLIDTEEKYVSVGNIFILIMAFIGGGIIPYIYLPQGISILSKYTINYWAINGFIGILTNGKQDVIVSFTILAMLSISFVLISLLIFSYKEGRGRT